MRVSKMFGSMIVAAAAVFVMGASSDARAEDEFDVQVQGDKIVVTAKGEWHVNKEYPWKAKGESATLDKGKFSFTEKAATVSGAPKGKVIVKGGVCSGDKCKNFEKEVKI